MDSILPSPSTEQAEILHWFRQGYNINTISVAGSGKSTLLCHAVGIVKDTFQVACLMLTYNKTLQLEVEAKLTTCGYNGTCGVYTYHGLATTLSQRAGGPTIHDDVSFRKFIHQPRATPWTGIPDIILVDEAQDLNADYYEFIRLLLRHGSILVLVGDARQCINQYCLADSKYLTACETYFDTGRPWKRLSLRTSYRLTPAMATFVNTHILNDDLIVGGNTTCPNLLPVYWFNVFDLKRGIEAMVKKYGADEVAVIMASVKAASNPRSPLGMLLGGRANIPLVVMDDKVSMESTKGKVVISSWNSFKGRERKCIFVVGFDESYFSYYDKKWSATNPEVPNIIYVAATRAREQLILVQGNECKPFRTVKMDQLHEHCLQVGIKGEEKVSGGKDHVPLVTDCLRHRHLDDMLAMMAQVNVTAGTPGDALSSAELVQFPGYLEDVRTFYGMVIPIYYEWRVALDPGTYPRWISQLILEESKGAHPQYNEERDEWELFPRGKDGFKDIRVRLHALLVRMPTLSIPEWMEVVVLGMALKERRHYYKDQITHYRWVDTEFVRANAERLEATLPMGGEFERNYHRTEVYPLRGSADYVMDNTIWELKCAASLTDEHILQLAAYVALHELETGTVMMGRLYNSRTEEMRTVTVSNPNAFLAVLCHRCQPEVPDVGSSVPAIAKPKPSKRKKTVPTVDAIVPLEFVPRASSSVAPMVIPSFKPSYAVNDIPELPILRFS